MKATFNPSVKEKFTTSHRKENKCYFESFSALTPALNSYTKQNELKAVVELRLYGTDTMWYACIWIHGKEIYRHGSGSAGGYGYHKPSAAAAEAIRNAGFTLDASISGVGDTAIEEALKAICVEIGHPEAMLFKAHQ